MRYLSESSLVVLAVAEKTRKVRSVRILLHVFGEFDILIDVASQKLRWVLDRRVDAICHFSLQYDRPPRVNERKT